MKTILFIATLAASFDPMLSTALAAGENCGDRAFIVEQLGSKYSEAPSAVGLSNNGALVQVFTSVDGSTWTILASAPNGYACLVAAGEDWQDGLKLVQPSGPSL